jgi:hypothetical protein
VQIVPVLHIQAILGVDVLHELPSIGALGVRMLP